MVANARAALRRKDYRSAEDWAGRISRDDRLWVQGRLIAGEAALRDGRYDDAIAEFSSVPRDGSKSATAAALSLGEACRFAGRLSDAENAYRYVLETQSGHAAAHERMAFLLGATGRRWESREHLLARIRQRAWTPEEIVLLGDLERPMEQGDFLRRCEARQPKDAVVQLGLAADAVGAGHAADARRRLTALVAAGGAPIAAHAMLGEFLVNEDGAAFAAWRAGVPSAGLRDPDIWYVLGLRARRVGKPEVAVRCFWEAVRLVPAHRRGNVQLGQILGSLGGHEAAAAAFTERGARFVELTRMLDDVLRSDWRNEAAVRRAAELTEATGRLWEARSWAEVGGKFFPQSAWPQEIFATASAALPPDAPQTVETADLAKRFDFSGFPGEEALFEGGVRPSEPRVAKQNGTAQIRFTDEAAAVGLDFVYDNSNDPETRGVRVFEQNGGGVGVLDFDVDGRPDLYFTQGARWPTGSDRPTPAGDLVDRLYRNAHGAAVDVTALAGCGDAGFGQGCAVADFDGDGFPDLYVANIGRNSLFRNNGDGTFRDVTAEAGIDGGDWTASCVMADLTGDGFPDLFDATYVTGPDVYQAICDGHACSPKAFDGTPDRLRVSRGDGTFEPAADLGTAEGSKGLGVVAVDVDGSGRLGLFVANDQVPNFLFRHDRTELGRFSFDEEAFASGVAFNEDGLAMASMGVAADDADGDGRIDFFVTTFKDEPRLLFLQDSPGLFVDGSNAAGLRAIGWPYVGWGTQFLDADRDGEPDLVAVNGHVDDYRDEGGKFQMKPQFFRNTGAGRFVEAPAEDLGAWFDGEYLGRGLARLDWDGDGLADFAASMIGSRAALVLNRTDGAGHFLNVRLHATGSARDAIGATVEVVSAGRRWTKQLTAGDGYMASNERMLQFGIGGGRSISELRVSWPSGSVTALRDLPADATIDVVEGRAKGLVLSTAGAGALAAR